MIEYAARIVPTIIIGRYYPDRGLHHVFPDYQQIADRIDSHLVSMGHDRYAIIGRDIVADYSQVWYQAFSTSYQRRGRRFLSGDFIDVRPWHIDRLASLLLDHHRFLGKEIQAYVLQTSSHLEPLVADDRFRQKLKGELSIIAFDYGKYPMEAYWPGRTVTHVRTSWAVAARTAMDNLGLLIMNRDVPEAVRLTIDFEPGQTVYPYHIV
jgi:DNA-binding LacI/PurR family transcriptional regulator